ncbi:hypothetical protein BJ165DRAFT_1614013 [Panaeolus papilionaceus]|nr:hypothetical protein BJ165DRAFT_1614013 [Panaeolus papilionaceus]
MSAAALVHSTGLFHKSSNHRLSANSPIPSSQDVPSTPSSEASSSKTLHRLRSTLEQSLRSAKRTSSKKPPPPPVPLPPPLPNNTIDEFGKSTRRGKEKEAEEKDSKLNLLRKVTFRRAPRESTISKGNGVGNEDNDNPVRVAGFTSFLTPSLRQASMSSPALHFSESSAIAAPAVPTKSRPALPSTSTRSRRTSQPVQISQPTPLVPQTNTSRHRSAKSYPTGLPPSPSTPTLVQSRTRGDVSSPSPTPYNNPQASSSRAQLARHPSKSSSSATGSTSTVVRGRSTPTAASSSSPTTTRASSPTSNSSSRPTVGRATSASRSRVVTPPSARANPPPTNLRGLTSVSTSQLPLSGTLASRSTPTPTPSTPTSRSFSPPPTPTPASGSSNARRGSIDMRRGSVDGKRPSVDLSQRRGSIDGYAPGGRRPSVDLTPTTRAGAPSPTPASTRGGTASTPNTPIRPRPRAVSPSQRSYSQNRHFNISSGSLVPPTSPTSASIPVNLELNSVKEKDVFSGGDERERGRGRERENEDQDQDIVRRATKLLVYHLSRPPAHIMKNGEAGTREWGEVEKRMEGLKRVRRLDASRGGREEGDEEMRKAFAEAVRDGYVLCQLLNKLNQSPLVRPSTQAASPSSPSASPAKPSNSPTTSNITRFLAACASHGFAGDELFRPDDLRGACAAVQAKKGKEKEGKEGLEKIARCVVGVVNGFGRDKEQEEQREREREQRERVAESRERPTERRMSIDREREKPRDRTRERSSTPQQQQHPPEETWRDRKEKWIRGGGLGAQSQSSASSQARSSSSNASTGTGTVASKYDYNQPLPPTPTAEPSPALTHRSPSRASTNANTTTTSTSSRTPNPRSSSTTNLALKLESQPNHTTSSRANAGASSSTSAAKSSQIGSSASASTPNLHSGLSVSPTPTSPMKKRWTPRADLMTMRAGTSDESGSGSGSGSGLDSAPSSGSPDMWLRSREGMRSREVERLRVRQPETTSAGAGSRHRRGTATTGAGNGSGSGSGSGNLTDTRRRDNLKDRRYDDDDDDGNSDDGTINDDDRNNDAMYSSTPPPPPILMRPPPRSPLRKPSLKQMQMDKQSGGLISWAKSAADPSATSSASRSSYGAPSSVSASEFGASPRTSIADSTRASIGDASVFGIPPSSPSIGFNARRSVASTALSEAESASTGISSVLDGRMSGYSFAGSYLSSGAAAAGVAGSGSSGMGYQQGGYNYGTIRTMTTDMTSEGPSVSLTKDEGREMIEELAAMDRQYAQSHQHGGLGYAHGVAHQGGYGQGYSGALPIHLPKKRSAVELSGSPGSMGLMSRGYSRERKISEVPPVDLMRVAEEGDDLSISSKGHGERERERREREWAREREEDWERDRERREKGKIRIQEPEREVSPTTVAPPAAGERLTSPGASSPSPLLSLRNAFFGYSQSSSAVNINDTPSVTTGGHSKTKQPSSSTSASNSSGNTARPPSSQASGNTATHGMHARDKERMLRGDVDLDESSSGQSRVDSRTSTPVGGASSSGGGVPLAISSPRKLAIVRSKSRDGDGGSPGRGLSPLPRRPSHRPQQSLDSSTPSILLPKERLLRRDASPDSLTSSSPSRVMLRRHSTKQGISPRSSGISYVPRSRGSAALDDSPSGTMDGPVPFPRTTSFSGDSPRSSTGDNLLLNSDRPRLRGRFQSDIEGSSARWRARPNSYDEIGGRSPARSRFESMVNLGVASGSASASDLMNRDSIDGSAVRARLVVKEDGKPPTHFQLGNCIGRGQFGSVYRALNLNTGQMVAVKRIRLEGLKEEEVTQLMREVDLVKSLSHPSIVKYEGMARDDDTLSIVLEYAENGSLGQTLKSFGKLNEKLVASYVVKILEGLHYLHTSDVVHCDLKAANILTTKNGNVKLSDFGVSLNLRAMGGEIKDVAGTPNWMAPEVIELKGASTKSDIWSLGCTVIELLTGRPPYAEIANSMSVMFRIVEDDSPPLPEDCSELLRDFLEHCFYKDPNRRPSAEFLCEHPWLKNNWVALQELRPQDSIPFLRRVSTDLQKVDVVRYLAGLDVPDSPISASPGRRAEASPAPVGRRTSMSSVRPMDSEISPREHTFVKTTFSKPMVCRVCLSNVKKSAVLCSQCSLISHSKCAPNAPPTCDLRAQLLLYAQYAEKGNPASAYHNPAEFLGDLGQNVALSDVPFVDSASRTGSDALPIPRSPQSSSSPTDHGPTAFKFMAAFKRSRSNLSPESVATANSNTSSGSPQEPREVNDNTARPRPGVPKRQERPLSMTSVSTGVSSMRSAATANESFSSRQNTVRSALSGPNGSDRGVRPVSAVAALEQGERSDARSPMGHEGLLGREDAADTRRQRTKRGSKQGSSGNCVVQ